LAVRQVAAAGLLQVDELLQVLLGAEVAFELADEAVERAVERFVSPAPGGTGRSGR
jgi:hypothetical protein